MYKWLTILSVIILAAVCGMGWLGYHSIRLWAQGLEGTRIGEFAEVAEQIRQDVKHKLDEFMEKEQKRPYTDYQYFYFPDSAVARQQQQAAIERSPLADQLEHGLAYYNFQIQPDGRITTPNVFLQEQQAQIDTNRDEKLYAEAILNTKNIEDNLLPILDKVDSDPYKLDYEFNAESSQRIPASKSEEKEDIGKKLMKSEFAKGGKIQNERTQNYPIESLKNPDEQTQVIRQSRDFIASNEAQSQEIYNQQTASTSYLPQRGLQADLQEGTDISAETSQQEAQRNISQNQPAQRLNQQLAASQTQRPQTVQTTEAQSGPQSSSGNNRADMVEIRIEPFVPVIVPGQNSDQSIFRGQVFMLRRVQIEDKSYLQGFQLNEKKLLEEVEESARRFIRDDMGFDLAMTQSEPSAYTAILDFASLGHLMLNLRETDPAWIGRQIHQLRTWYLGIMSFVFLAVTLALGSLWLSARAQLKLAQKKDDFISAVSHELRTPLTSIRMHAEMLEKNWIKSEGKLTEYYKNMRQESERLSRLIENVLDFSRIQRGRKKYLFKAGDINKYVEDVVEMMAPYAAQRGFSIKTELSQIGEITFDGDAVTQIVVNLLDNAIKYARNATDKTVTIRTKSDNQYTIIEVEDHGPGIPHSQREKIFQEFYRIGAEATRETAGSGLGLALVKKFVQAHNGFVEIINAKPNGVIFRAALSTRM
jgi:signal transduction histidine kinase